MKTLPIRFLIIAGALGFAVSPIIHAQGKPDRPAVEDRGEGRGDRMKMLVEKLDLSPEQIEQLRPIMRANMESMKALRDDAAVDRKARREQMRTMREAHRQALATVLTPEQLAKLDEMRPGRGPGAGGQRSE